MFLNGNLLPAEKAGISIEDKGFLYGYGVFETMAVHKGYPLFLELHLERLKSSLEYFKFTAYPAAEELAGFTRQVIEKNKIKEGYVRLVITAGDGGQGLGFPFGPSTVLINCGEGITYPSELYQKGLSAVILQNVRRNEFSPLVSYKTLNFLENVLGKQEALSRGTEEGLFLNTAGLLAEGTVSNIFLFTKGELVTPSKSAGVLPGIIRRVVLELAVSNNIPVRERNILPEGLFSAKECFLTNSLMGIMPLVVINGRSIGNGTPGTLTGRLIELYQRKIAKYDIDFKFN